MIPVQRCAQTLKAHTGERGLSTGLSYAWGRNAGDNGEERMRVAHQAGWYREARLRPSSGARVIFLR